MKKILIAGALMLSAITLYNCGNGNGNGNGNSGEGSHTVSVSPVETAKVSDTLNLSVFVDLSDRITKERDHMKQNDKDKT
ncbi:MAG: hypothetical protein K2K08_08940, partial [Paramuribaculum sp.]|nr:hypothetical protein [Paramuribaculum sp.]